MSSTSLSVAINVSMSAMEENISPFIRQPEKDRHNNDRITRIPPPKTDVKRSNLRKKLAARNFKETFFQCLFIKAEIRSRVFFSPLLLEKVSSPIRNKKWTKLESKDTSLITHELTVPDSPKQWRRKTKDTIYHRLASRNLPLRYARKTSKNDTILSRYVESL